MLTENQQHERECGQLHTLCASDGLAPGLSAACSSPSLYGLCASECACLQQLLFSARLLFLTWNGTLLPRQLLGHKCLVNGESVLYILSVPHRGFAVSAVQREYRSRKTRKKEKRLRKGEDEVSAAFRESQATIDAAQKRRMQSETLEALFEIFFRVLKQCTASGYAAADRKGETPDLALLIPAQQKPLHNLTSMAHRLIAVFRDLPSRGPPACCKGQAC